MNAKNDEYIQLFIILTLFCQLRQSVVVRWRRLRTNIFTKYFCQVLCVRI